MPTALRPSDRPRLRGAGATLGFVLAACIPALAGQQPEADPGVTRRARAIRIADGSRIAVDGRLDEAEWQQAPPADGFVQQQPVEGAPATPEHRSEIRFLYDSQNLYIGATFREDELDRLVTNELKRDFNARDGDLYVVILDTFRDRLNAYNFQTNPGCALRDSQSYDDGRTINANWDGVWFCRSSVGDGAWYVEEAIPFKQLRFPRSEDQTWGLQLFRLIRHSNEITLWSPTPRQFNQFKTSYAGILEGIRGIRPSRNIRVKPFVTGEARRANGTGTGSGDGGVDVKIGIGTGLVLDGTYRTDFSQVETDAQQVNLTRFSLFFPEKREFFLENQGAFQIGPPAASSSNLVPFFSRTIGLSEAGNPIPIVGGLRLTGKAGRNSVGLLNMQTEPETRAGGLPDLPSANVSVLRYAREFGTNSTAGLFYLDKERGGSSNRLAGADLRFYPTRALNIDGMFMRSDTTGLEAGMAWRGGAQYTSGLSQYTVQYTSLGDTFRDELGFVPRQGVDILNGDVLRRIRPAALAPAVRELRLTLPYARYTRDALDPATGSAIGVETETLDPSVTLEFADASTLQFGVRDDEEALTAPFRPQGIPVGASIPAGRHHFTRGTVSYKGSNSRRLAFTGEYRFGGYYNGRRAGVTAGGRVRFSRNLAATLSVARDVIDLPAGVSFDTNLASLRVDASFSTRMFLNAFIQYNSVMRQLSSNIRYQFTHHPLSDVFLVYNDTRFAAAGPFGPGQPPSRALIVKMTHLVSF